jgi:hypothetical protein
MRLFITNMSLGQKKVQIFVYLFLFFICSAIKLFSQTDNRNSLVIYGNWEYCIKDFSGDMIKSNRKFEVYKNVSLVITNNIDSSKLIKSPYVVKNLKETFWEFDSCTVITFNKFGESKKQSYIKLKIPSLKIKSKC